MIKASDVASHTRSFDSVAAEQIETHIDKAIQRHLDDGRAWPLTVGTTRSGWSTEDIKAALNRYRDNGWTVLSGGRHDLCVLQPAPGDAP